MAATNQTETTSQTGSDFMIVERARVDTERRLAGQAPGASDAPWTACRVPERTLVIGAGGSCRGCEAAAGPSVRLAALDATWTNGALVELRRALAAGHLPRASCHTCVRWLEADLWAQSPMLRLHDGEPTPADASGPTHLVVHLPAGKAPLPPALEALLSAALPKLRELTVATTAADGAALAALLALLRAAPKRPRLTLRIARLAKAQAARTALADVGLGAVELVATTREAPFAAAAELAKSCSASVRATFVLTPASWFDFEDAAIAAGDADVPLALRTIDANGEVPLDAVALEALQVVKSFVVAAWQRLGGEARPRSLAPNAQVQLAEELRAVLAQRAEQAIRGVAAPSPTPAALELPPGDHPWLADAARRPWYLALLFGQANQSPVRAWLATVARATDAVERARAEPWVRHLLQAAAAIDPQDDWLRVLRAVYGVAAARPALLAADTAFARELPLEPYGGPWAGHLGLAAAKPRKRPFAIGRPRANKDASAPDLTVLIPSYRHGAFIEETLRSVLAQRHTNFRVLVVDDCSPDDTAARARGVTDPRVEVRVNATNLGLGNSVLQALAAIDTPFVALLNSDDLFHPDRLGTCRDVLLRAPDVNLVTTGLSLIDSDGGELTPSNVSFVLDGRLVFDWVHWFERVTPPADLPRERLFETLLEHSFLATSSNLVARTDWLRAQAESLRSLKYCLDWQLFLQAAATGSLHHVHEPLASYRLHASNTVWFREGQRWSYYLEVHRVAANALRQFANLAQDGSARVERVLDAVASHLARNRETDGFALFLNAALDALQLDAIAAATPRVRELVQRLNEHAEALRTAEDRANEAARAPTDTTLPHRLLLGELARERMTVERDARRWLRGYCLTLESQVSDCWAGRGTLEAEKSSLLQRQGELDGTVQRLQDAERQLHERLRERQAEEQRLAALFDVERTRSVAQSQRADAMQRDLDGARKELAAVRSELAAVRADRESVRGSLAAIEEHGARLAAELAAMRGERTMLAADLERAHAATAATRQERDAAQQRAGELDGALAQRTAETQALARAKSDLEQTRDGLVHELARAREAMQKLVQSREYRWGNFVWNKTPLAYLSRRGKKWYRRLVDAKNRAAMVFRRRRRAQGVAIVAACWHWPIYSHTFVYQEMIGLTHMGLDVQMFHWDLGDTSHLHKAFAYLADHRTQLQPIWENHVRDREHFEKTKPGRLHAFLELVSQRTGRTIADLEKEPLVVQGCTFARMAELAGAKYLHSYFFYDQSFMVMQAAWLLGIPRGVSCYADHMLDDYPFKLVDLHVELADVVVATSARIKRELSQKSRGRFDDKILVKPNGVDGARFPAIARIERGDREPFEVLSISRIEPKKGLIHLVEAIAELEQRGVHVVAHVVGSKDAHSKGSLEYAAAFEQRIAELGVADKVVLHGVMKQEDLAPLLRKCRAFVAPYVEVASGDKDGIPTSMLEALASALPIVTTDAGSILEVVDDDVEGIVVGQGDSRAFADALARLVADPALQRRMAKAARARFERDFDIGVTEKRLHARVAALIAANRRSR